MKKREIGIDMIKTIAICMVSGLHFFLNTNYYGMQMDYSIMIVEAFVKWLMLSAVALFLLTTGYLQCEKKLTISYYKKLLPILIAYAGISCIVIIYHLFQGNMYTLGDIIFAITEFEADRYAWYVNMFIGLYLMIPFLNRIIKDLNKKEYLIWLIVLLLVISVPFTFNPLFTLFFKQSHALFPDWWMGMYPFLFYFIGAYIRKFKPQIPKMQCIGGIVLLLCMQTFFTYSTGKPTLWNDIATIGMVMQINSHLSSMLFAGHKIQYYSQSAEACFWGDFRDAVIFKYNR